MSANPDEFSGLAAAGEIATRAGILPWPAGEATRAAAICFAAWRENRAAGDGQSEEATHLARVRGFLEVHGDSRFTAITSKSASAQDGLDGTVVDGGQRTSFARAGYRKQGPDGWQYLILPEVWRTDVCAGLNATEVARTLAEKGHLERGDGDNLTVSRRISDLGKKVRLYVIRSSIFEE